MNKRKGKAQQKKRETFKKMFPDGRKAFAKAKRKLGLKRGQATKHKEIIGKLK